jgi:hypothetical protein
MKLYHGTTHVADISDVSAEGIWMSGRIRLTAEGTSYRPFFEYMTDDRHGLDETPPFGNDLLNADEWFVLDNGKRAGIEVPAVHPDGTVEWRWR